MSEVLREEISFAEPGTITEFSRKTKVREGWMGQKIKYSRQGIIHAKT